MNKSTDIETWAQETGRTRRPKPCPDRKHKLVWHVPPRTSIRRQRLIGTCSVCGFRCRKWLPVDYVKVENQDHANQLANQILDYRTKVRFIPLSQPKGKIKPPSGFNGRGKKAREKDLCVDALPWRHNDGYNHGVLMDARTVVLDFDDLQALRAAQKAPWWTWKTLIVRTRRGAHVYFKLPPKVRLQRVIHSSLVLGPGVDLIPLGHYVVGPGSKVTHGGQDHQYDVHVTLGGIWPEVATMPADLLKELQDEEEMRTTKTPAKMPVPKSHGADAATWAAMRAMPAGEVVPGCRDMWVFCNAAHAVKDELRAKGKCSRKRAVAIAHQLNNQIGEPLPKKQIAQKLTTLPRWGRRLAFEGWKLGTRWSCWQQWLGGLVRGTQRTVEARKHWAETVSLRNQGYTWASIGAKMGCAASTALRRFRAWAAHTPTRNSPNPMYSSRNTPGKMPPQPCNAPSVGTVGAPIAACASP